MKSEGAEASPNKRKGSQALNYYNPGSKSYDDKDKPSNPERRYSNGEAYGIAIGKNTDVRDSSKDSNGIALGDYSKATGGLAMALGSFSRAEKNGGIAPGIILLPLVLSHGLQVNQASHWGLLLLLKATNPLQLAAWNKKYLRMVLVCQSQNTTG